MYEKCINFFYCFFFLFFILIWLILFFVAFVVVVINDKIQQQKQQQQKCIISKSLYILFYNILNSTLYMKHALESLIFNKISIGRKSGCRVYVYVL